MSVVSNDTPPYVVFERRPVEDRNASVIAGHHVHKDVDYAVITRAGARDTFEQEVAVWFAQLERKVRDNQFPGEWLRAYRNAYEAWCKGEELPAEGTPVKTWPVASPAQIKDMLAVGIRTVEDLAQLPDSELSSLGIGAMSLKQKAQAWLLSSKDSGKATEQLATMQRQLADLSQLAQAQAAEIANLRAQLPQPVKKPG
jgi:hypothetical protein